MTPTQNDDFRNLAVEDDFSPEFDGFSSERGFQEPAKCVLHCFQVLTFDDADERFFLLLLEVDELDAATAGFADVVNLPKTMTAAANDVWS